MSTNASGVLAADPVNNFFVKGLFGGGGPKQLATPQSSIATGPQLQPGSLAASNSGMGGSVTNPGMSLTNTGATAVDNATNSINAAFANRAPQYQQFLGATQNLYQQQLAQQNAVATRNLKFALARSGQTGGSLATDQGAELGREMAAGTLSAQQKAEGALSGLESQDNSQRLQLLGEANSGANLTTGAQQAGQAMMANLGAAQSAANANNLGDVFGGISNSINQINNAKQVQAGIRSATAYTTAGSPSGVYGR